MPLNLPITMDDRRFHVGEQVGEVFGEDTEFDGLVVTIEIKTPDEAKAILAAVFAAQSS